MEKVGYFLITVHKFCVHLCLKYTIFMASNMAFIYYLQNPTTLEIFYVGATQCSLNNRLRTHYQHLREFERGDRYRNKRYDYLSNLRPNKATIHLLEIVTDISLLNEREQFYISHYRRINPNLTNMTDGGRGKHTSKYYTDEQMLEYTNKISIANKGKKKPKGFSENLSIARKGLGNPAAKPIRNNGIIGTKDRVNFIWFRYGFEVNNYFNNKSAYSNVYRFVNTKNKPYGYEFKYFDNATIRVQDIVRSQHESV